MRVATMELEFGALHGHIASMASSNEAEQAKRSAAEKLVADLQKKISQAMDENDKLRQHSTDTQTKASESVHELRRMYDKCMQGADRSSVARSNSNGIEVMTLCSLANFLST